MKEATPHPATPISKPQQPFFDRSGDHSFFTGDAAKQTDSFFEATGVQPKLTVGGKDGPLEKQADATADGVVGQLNSPSSAGAGPGSEQKQDRKNTPADKIQRSPALEGEEKKDGKGIQRKPSQAQPVMLKTTQKEVAAPASIESSLASAREGSPLSDQTRGTMETAFGADFSGVRIHNDGEAAQLSNALGAQAFTHGSDIYFDEGKYNTASSGGMHLLAHELTHTLQQNTAAGSGQSSVAQSPSNTISREPNQEYVPQIRKDPDFTFTMIGSQLEQRFEVTNAADAPRNTTFYWGGGITEMEKLAFLSMQDARGGRSTTVKAKAMAPGDTALAGNLVHQVPGGPEMIHEGVSADVEVARPSVANINYFKILPDGNFGDDYSILNAGEILYADVELADVDLGIGYSPVSTASIGSPVLNPDTANPQYGRVTAPNTVRFIFTPDQFGTSSNSLTIRLGNTPDNDVITVDLAPVNVVMSKQRFLERCNLVNTQIDLADRRARAWLSSISVAYGTAWQHHTDTLRAQDANNRLIGELILGAALAFIPGGVGGVVGAAMKRLGQSDFMVDGIKDLAKWGLREAGGRIGRGLSPGASPMTAFPTDPLQWQNLTEMRITDELAVATDTLLAWQTNASNEVPDFILNFDPVLAMQESLNVGGTPAAELRPVDINEYAINYEKGFWSDWLREYAFSLRMVVNQAGIFYRVEENYGKEIERRCSQIGLDITPYVEEARQRKQEEADRRNPFYMRRP